MKKRGKKMNSMKRRHGRRKRVQGVDNGLVDIMRVFHGVWRLCGPSLHPSHKSTTYNQRKESSETYKLEI